MLFVLRNNMCTIPSTQKFRLSHKICSKFCCALFCLWLYYHFFIWHIYPYHSGLLHWHWSNHLIVLVPLKYPWRTWVNQSIMMTSSKGNIFHVTGQLCGEFTGLRPVTRSFDVFFYLRLNKKFSKQWWGWWIETPSRLLWRHCNDLHNQS